MYKRIDKNQSRKRRHLRVRKKISGTAERPRLNVYRSLTHIYAQIIDDVQGNTLVSASTAEVDERTQCQEHNKKQSARLVGKLIAQRAVEKGLKAVVFDRGGYYYTGRVAELADGAREAGLEF